MVKAAVISFIILFTSIHGYSQNWLTDFSIAKEQSETQHKKIVLVFSGSDWCGPCIKLDNEIWKSEEFKEYAADNFVMLKADFPRKKKNKLSKEQQGHNDLLAEKYRAEFPLVVVLNSSGDELGRIGFKKDFSPKDYINYISEL